MASFLLPFPGVRVFKINAQGKILNRYHDAHSGTLGTVGARNANFLGY
jgi:hypothetical protein